MSEISTNTKTSSDTTTNTGYKQELKRSLSLMDLIIFGLITMLIIAPIEVYGSIAKASNGMAPLVYLVGIIAMVFTAMSYSKMSQEFPIAGSVYSYVQRGLNPHIGFVTGWLIAIDYIMAPALLTSFSAIWLQSVIPSVPTFVLIFIFLAINTYINARGISLTARSNMIFLCLEVLILVIFIGFAVKFIFIDGHGTGGFSLAPMYQADKVDLNFIASAASIAVLGFLGFDVISTLSEEVKNPGKTVGRATIASLIIIGLVFIIQAYLAALAHPNYEDLDDLMAFFDIAREVGGDFLYYLFIFVGIAAVGIANALTIHSAIARIIFSMSRDKVLPFSGALAKVHPVYKTPFNSTIFVGIVSLIVASAVSIDTIISLVNFGALTSFAVLNLAVFVHFYIRKRRRGFKGFINYLLLPAIGFCIIAYVWSGFDKMTYIVGFSWMLVGVIIGAVKSKGYKEVPPVLRDM